MALRERSVRAIKGARLVLHAITRFFARLETDVE